MNFLTFTEGGLAMRIASVLSTAHIMADTIECTPSQIPVTCFVEEYEHLGPE